MTKPSKAQPAKATKSPGTDTTGEPVPGQRDTTGPVDTVAEAEQLQHPAAAGYPEVEIAKRSQDIDTDSASRHEKVFVVQRNPLDADFTADQDLHVRNIDAMRQSAILQGLRPTSDGEFVGSEEHPDGQSVCLRYAVDVVPASIATPEQNVVAVTVEQQHDLDKQHSNPNKEQ